MYCLHLAAETYQRMVLLAPIWMVILGIFSAGVCERTTFCTEEYLSSIECQKILGNEQTTAFGVSTTPHENGKTERGPNVENKQGNDIVSYAFDPTEMCKLLQLRRGESGSEETHNFGRSARNSESFEMKRDANALTKQYLSTGSYRDAIGRVDTQSEDNSDDDSSWTKSSRLTNEMLLTQMESLLALHDERVQQSLTRCTSDIRSLNDQATLTDQALYREMLERVAVFQQVLLGELLCISTFEFYVGAAVTVYVLTLAPYTQSSRVWLFFLLILTALTERMIWRYYIDQLERDVSAGTFGTLSPEYISGRLWICRLMFGSIGILLLIFSLERFKVYLSATAKLVTAFVLTKILNIFSDRVNQNIRRLIDRVRENATYIRASQNALHAPVAKVDPDRRISGHEDSTRTDAQSRWSVPPPPNSFVAGRYHLRQRRSDRPRQTHVDETVEEFMTYVLDDLPRQSALRRENLQNFLRLYGDSLTTESHPRAIVD